MGLFLVPCRGQVTGSADPKRCATARPPPVHPPPFPGLLCGPGWQPALPGQLCPQTSCPGQPMGSPGGGWEGRRREGSGCFLVFSALASHDCRVCRVHPAPKLGLPASPAASSHLCENLRRHLSFLHGILLTATPRLDGTKGHPREGWGTGGRAATLDRHPGERQAVTSSLPPTRQSLPLLVHHLSGWRGACPTPAGLPGEVTENKTNAGAERGDRESAVWRDRAHARLAEAKKTQPGEAPAPRLRPSSQSRRRRLEEKGRRRAARSRATTCCQGPTTGGTRLTSAGPSRPGSCARGGPCAHAHPTRASIRPAGRRGDVKGPVTREGRLAPGRDGHSQLRWVISLTRPVREKKKEAGGEGTLPRQWRRAKPPPRCRRRRATAE